ncbi:MAG: chromosome segregation protein SMC [Sedimentisphaerales bacterium]|nr:chromosome segregation protein SMC [Sedimentisphaerales bacterium]
MKLEKIVLNGFKSFADKTEFNFESPITAIVGPNGCGKSNVVDAVKWVLGEQSVKSLRSGQMADVIFGGSTSRKPLGAAEVTIVLSNPEGIGKQQLQVDCDRIEVTRKIYKSGESEYRINNKICRLKDVRELFMDTGVGTKAYSILEQGQIDYLVSASKIDRRSIFEEAAGISKYKAHKKEALRKLERTEQNLLRLADILGEVEKRLRSVKLQAGKARNYLQYTQRLKELQVNYSLVEYDKILTLFKEKENQHGCISEQFGLLASEVAQNDSLISSLGENIIETEHKLNHAGNSLVSVRSKIEQLVQRIDFLRSRVTELQQRRGSAQEKVEKLQEQMNIFEQNTSQYRNELISCEKMIQEKSGRIEELQETIKEVNTECASLEANLEDEKSGIIDIVRRTAQLHNEVQSISVYRNNLSSQKERLAGRAQTAREELEELLTEKAQHDARSVDIEKVLDDLKNSLESKRSKVEELNNLITVDNKRLSQGKETRSAISSELAILTDMERRCEGLKAGVKSILQTRSADSSKFDYVEGMLAEMITTDIEYANAVEAALEGLTDALVTSSTGRMLGDREEIEKIDGRVDFICLDQIGPFMDKNNWSEFPSVKGRLVEFVKFDNKYAPLVWKLLGKTLIVDSISDAIAICGKVEGECNFVTLKGEFLGSDGIVKLGPLGKATGLISRKSRLRQLQETINNVSSEIAALENQIERNSQASEHLEKLCKDLRTAIYEANTEKMQVGSKLEMTEQNIKRLRQEVPLLAGEIDMLAEQIAQSVQKEYDSKQKLQELEEVNQQRTKQIELLEKTYAEQKEYRQTLESRLTDLKIALGQIIEQRKASQQIINSMQKQIQENNTAALAAREEISNCIQQLASAQRDILNCEAGVSGLFIEKEKCQTNSRSLRVEIDKLVSQRDQAEEILRVKRSEKEQTEQQINDLKIEIGQLQVKQQDLVERVRDQLQIDLVQSYQNYTRTEVDWEQIKEEINELRSKIERLGNVNVDAIEEQESLETRQEFLSSQVHDLNSSKGQLQQLINRLNVKSRDKFQETFNEIRGNFQEIFRKLFGGGKADIMLEDSEDILEAGVEIVAKPPGKETRSISLLSGGEKSMTALALLFAVFKSKPSPFCFLDEVDAALDEANNERFNMLLQEFQKESHFVVITHSKRTMSVAGVLFGITMQIRGVSKKISVKFSEYEEETAAVA